jgi:hypothetical protein
MQDLMNELGEMKSAAAGALRNLFPAGESVGDNDGVGRRLADGRQERALAYLRRNLMMVFFKTESAGHSAAAGFWFLDFKPQSLKEVPVRSG